MLRFHPDTFELLGTKPHLSQPAINQIEVVEKRLGIQLPGAVYEWYLYVEAIQILTTYSNKDRPIPIAEFVLEKWNNKTLLPFKKENQGVCIWAILLNDADNPPVYVTIDGHSWLNQADTFSEHIYSCVWDYTTVFEKPALLQAQHDPVSDHVIERLKTEFTEKISTYNWPGKVQYRFSREQQAILIWAAENQADWFVAANNADALHSILATVWHWQAVGPSFYDCTPIAKTVLEQFV